ncbi:GMC oxidoreductase [Glonium stellatum]|uniref:GMC oxidoreductase n=1 Tax=Glonium stellatum TaxID=574774 RepID=A0A8E2F4W4_9PEZI|nr:GMC oxidoreductase [Glonium stellatum]
MGIRLNMLSYPILLAFLSVVAAAPNRRLYSSAFGYPGQNASFDYVVIGGGTAGLVVAARLAETASVAVIEAGGFYEQDNSNNSVVPLLSLTGIAFIDPTATFTPQPLMDWSLLSQPVTNAGNRRIHYAQGKTLGGSSAINTMSYVRGTIGSYQRWADTVGDQSYTFANLLKYFKKSCHLTPPNLAKRNSTNATVLYDPTVFDSSGGPLQVSWNNWVDPTLTWLAKAVQAIGLPLSPKGFNSGQLNGYGSWVPSTISPDHAYRSSSESSFLRQAIRDTGIIVYPHTQAMKVLFDSSSPPKATGVLVSTQGLEYQISANKEVIVSAGTFHSPQLLMVSGIGPSSVLESYSIPVLSDLPGVGQNLWDPISFGVSYPVSTPSGQSLTANPALAPGFVQQYLTNASGPFSSAAGYLSCERIPEALRRNLSASTQAKLATFPSDWPEIEYIVGSFVGANLTTIAAIVAWIPTPFSRGNVTISSASMSDPPVINLGWLTDPSDGEVAVAAFRRLRTIWGTAPANAIKTGPELLPGSAVQSYADILNYIRQSATQIWHACATCAMGKEGDANAVVDSKARVFGVSGLRVVDASAFPFVQPGHIQSSVYALAEKIADDIKNGN